MKHPPGECNLGLDSDYFKLQPTASTANIDFVFGPSNFGHTGEICLLILCLKFFSVDVKIIERSRTSVMI